MFHRGRASFLLSSIQPLVILFMQALSLWSNGSIENIANKEEHRYLKVTPSLKKLLRRFHFSVIFEVGPQFSKMVLRKSPPLHRWSRLIFDLNGASGAGWFWGNELSALTQCAPAPNHVAMSQNGSTRNREERNGRTPKSAPWSRCRPCAMEWARMTYPPPSTWTSSNRGTPKWPL